MSCIGNKVGKFRQVPNPYFALHITAKFLGGVGIGVLLAAWLPVWTWWIFIIVALIIAIPSARIILGKRWGFCTLWGRVKNIHNEDH